MSDISKQKLTALPPSAKLVFTVLGHEGQLTQKRLAEETRLSARTVRYALNHLTEIDAISEQVSFMDARQSLYSTNHSVSSSGIS
jgi:transcription initiation factor IIE alpha subunit